MTAVPSVPLRVRPLKGVPALAQYTQEKNNKALNELDFLCCLIKDV